MNGKKNNREQLEKERVKQVLLEAALCLAVVIVGFALVLRIAYSPVPIWATVFACTLLFFILMMVFLLMAYSQLKGRIETETKARRTRAWEDPIIVPFSILIVAFLGILLYFSTCISLFIEISMMFS